MEERFRRNRARPDANGNHSFNHEERKQSTIIFKGRIQLKEIYADLHLFTDDELENGIQMPSDELLCVIPLFSEQGLDAAEEYIFCMAEGIKIFGMDEIYSHQSREKLAIFYLIISFELKRKFNINFILRDELIAITKLSQLVNWISDLQSENDVRKILEKERSTNALMRVKVPEIKPAEKLLNTKELSSEIGVSEKTIGRHPAQFKVHWMGGRKFYYLSECFTYQKKS